MWALPSAGPSDVSSKSFPRKMINPKVASTNIMKAPGFDIGNHEYALGLWETFVVGFSGAGKRGGRWSRLWDLGFLRSSRLASVVASS